MLLSKLYRYIRHLSSGSIINGLIFFIFNHFQHIIGVSIPLFAGDQPQLPASKAALTEQKTNAKTDQVRYLYFYII